MILKASEKGAFFMYHPPPAVVPPPFCLAKKRDRLSTILIYLINCNAI